MLSRSNQAQAGVLGFLKRHPRFCRVFLLLVYFVADQYHSLLLNVFAFGYIRWSHSFAKLVVIVVHHGNSSLFGRFVVFLCAKVLFMGWVLEAVLTRFYELHQTIGRKEHVIRSQVSKYKRLVEICQEMSTAHASAELVLIIDTKLNFLRSQFRKHVREEEVTEYIHFRDQVPFMIKSMLSVVIFLTISRSVVCYLVLELILSCVYVYCSFVLNQRAVLATLFQVLTNTWYVCLLLVVFLTTRNETFDSAQNAVLLNLIVIKYYVCFFVLYVVRWRYKKSLVLPKSETDVNIDEQTRM